ncbi:MAG: sigma-70 family RNA polymerase sigma factor [Bacteroidales bacterium]|nr:sigma-70 family RNA polymerase sigma factor [Bacteroidales bacterium]
MKFEDDSFYIDQVKSGDVNAYTFLVEKHKDMVFTVAMKIAGNKEDAEEIAQDAFVKAYQSLDNFLHKAKFTTWIYRIVYNTAISKLRKKKLDKVTLQPEITETYTLDEIVENLDYYNVDEQKQMVDFAMGLLEPQEKLIISFYYLNDMPVDEIAEITGLSNSNVKVKLFRIRNKMQSALKNQLQESLKKMQP